MAAVNVKGANYTNYAADPKKMVDASSWHGRVRAVYDSYTLSSAEWEAGSTVKMGRIPTTARFIGGYLSTDTSFASSTLKVEIGSTEVRAAATLTAVNEPKWFAKNDGTELTTESDVTVTLVANTSPSSAIVFRCVVFYLVD